MDIKELLDDDDEKLDPQKFFNEEEYSTLIVNREGFSKKDNDIADLIESILDKEVSRAELETIFSKLKEKNAKKILVDSIKSADKISEKAKLVAACWESGLDFSEDILFFTKLACSSDFSLAMEALTVVENSESPIDEETLSKAIELVQSSESKNKSILEDLVSTLKHRAG